MMVNPLTDTPLIHKKAEKKSEAGSLYKCLRRPCNESPLGAV